MVANKNKITQKRNFALKLSAPLLKKRQKKEQLSPLPRKWNYSEMRKHIIVTKKSSGSFLYFS